MTTIYRLIGKGTTDSNGIAHMDYSTSDGGSTWTDISSNPGYTGTGAGLVELVASTDSTITTNSVKSDPYEIIDALFYDDGLTNHDSTNYSSVTALVEETVTEGVQITKAPSGSTNARYICNTGSSNDIQAEVTVKTEGQVRFGFIDTNNSVSFANVNNTEWSTCQLKRTNNTLTAYINGSQVSFQTNNADATDTLKFFMQIYNTTDTVSFIFKDVKLYII